MNLATAVARARLTSHPQAATRLDYETATEEIEERLTALPGLVALYRAGSLTAPGISDLDFVAVVDGVQQLPAIWPRLSERTRYLAMHSPCLVDVATFVRHRWFASLEPLRLVWGEGVEADEPPSPAYARTVVAAEGAVLTALRLAKIAVGGVLKVRPTLCGFYSLRYDLELAELNRVQAPQAWHFADELARLRESWFGRGDANSSLIAVVQTAGAALTELFTQLARRAAEVGVPERQDPFRLERPWTNVTVRGDTGFGIDVAPAHLPRLPTAFRRVAELQWQLARVELTLPTRVVGLVRDDGASDFGRERAELVRRYRTFLAEAGCGYAPIGFASTFTSA